MFPTESRLKRVMAVLTLGRVAAVDNITAGSAGGPGWPASAMAAGSHVYKVGYSATESNKMRFPSMALLKLILLNRKNKKPDND